MENYNLPTLYRQLSTRLVVIFLLVVISLSLALFLFWQSEQSGKQLAKTTLPYWQQQIDFQQQSMAAKTLIEKILSFDNASQYLIKHQALKNIFQRLSKLPQGKNNLYQGFLSQQTKIGDIISRLAKHSEINQQLKADAAIELQLISTSLTELIDIKQQQQQQLFKQITTDNVTDRVTANRAKAYARVMKQLFNYKQLQQLINNLFVLIKPLSITSSTDFLENIASISEHVFLVYDELLPSYNKNNEAEQLQLQFIDFEKLLLKKQNFLAKWRGQLRLSQQHRQQLLLWLQSLQTVEVTVKNTGKNPLYNKDNSLERNNKVVIFIQRYYPPLTQQKLVWIILGVIVCNAVLILFLLVNLRRNIKFVSLHIVTLAKQVTAGDICSQQAQEQVICAEEQEILSAIYQLKQPEYSKQNYLDLQEKITSQNHFLSKNNHCCFWQWPINSNRKEQVKLWRNVLVTEEQSATSWRRYFSKNACLRLIKQAKIAKKQNTIQQLELETLENKTVEITLCYQNKHWFGSMLNITTQAMLEHELANLAIKFDQQYHQMVRQEDTRQADLTKLLSQVMLQAQSISLDSGITVTQLYRVLSRINQRAEQAWIANEFLLLGENKTLITPVEHSLLLHDVNFAYEIYCAVINANMETSAQQNQIQLYYQNEILPLVKLDVHLFHQLFSMLSLLMLEKQFKAKLAISLRLHDKNSGQQSVLISFKLPLSEKQKNNILAEQLKLLMLEQSKLSKNTSNNLLALHALLSRLLITHVEVIENDESTSIQFTLPLALSSEQQIIEKTDLKQKHFLVISTDEQIKIHLDEILKTNHAFNHHLTKVEYFAKQYSIKQLTKQPISAVVLTSDNYAAIDVVVNHIASLPNKLKPKLLVMQTLSNRSFERHGFYAFTENLITQQGFIHHLKKLLVNEQDNNQYLSADYCQNYRYQSTQVEVLVATKNILEQQYLIRILTWFGMQVTVVGNSFSMLEYWRTGRYLVLITEFEQSPLIELNAGKTVARGVFSLTKQLFILPNEMPDLARNWQISVIEKVLDLSQLSNALKPWLKTIETVEMMAEHTNSLPKRIEKQPLIDADLSNAFIKQAFNLQTFARNQGSAELAAFMIDEYLLLLAGHIEELKVALTNKETKPATEILDKLMLIAKIMSATDFNESCLTLQQSLSNKKAANIPLLLEDLEQQAKILTLFAEAI